MSSPQAGPEAPPPRRPGRSRIGCLALSLVPLVPFVLLGLVAMAPVWISDHRLGLMVDRLRKHPLPAGAEWEPSDPQVSVSGGDSGDCWYDIRFELSTGRSVQEVLDHYRRAKIEDPDGELGDYEVMAWTIFDEPGAPESGTPTATPLIIDLGGTYSGGFDMRCW
ncbi:hypothetical protein GCM10010149_54340 [Nonomuraea roseoviolacea subsp. roseoviolacea]|uniref:Uncharacterized protein n=1 Tax=Nonomuraea roseoviolacea subsp. carminata TaxID=160689 RepID=A0ABT1K2K4_9ACTN|nr:hypothetical protein [Nonomuraea roseoviolacea]MCP2347254.1 hypothetical protein [Nonomuraea roseoviolacea subsp. carminata]